MAVRLETLDEERVLRDYLRRRTRDGNLNPGPRSPGTDVRTCSECGHRTAFTLDPEGTWFRCGHCGAFA